MPFLVKYVQDIPNNCSECPCSIHIAPTEVYCNARQKHFEVKDTRPSECGMMECNEVIDEEKYDVKICASCKYSEFVGLNIHCKNQLKKLCKDFSLWEAKE